MIRQNLRYILLFIFSVFLQTLIFDRICLSNYVTSYIYIIFILLLPVNINKYSALIYALLLGLCIDIFNSTQGINAAASVLLAYLRPYVLQFFKPHDEYDDNKSPSVKKYGFFWFLKYAGILIFVHHLFLFYIEILSFSHFFFTLVKVILSSLVSLFFVVLGHFIFSKD